MRFFALCFTLLMGCSGRQKPKCFECGLNEQGARAEAEERNTEFSPPKLLTLDELFASGRVVIGQRGECETWSVTAAPEESAKPALEHLSPY